MSFVNGSRVFKHYARCYGRFRSLPAMCLYSNLYEHTDPVVPRRKIYMYNKMTSNSKMTKTKAYIVFEKNMQATMWTGLRKNTFAQNH